MTLNELRSLYFLPLKSNQPSGLDWFSIKSFSEKTTYLNLINEKVENHSVNYDHGLRVEVLSNQQFAYAGTCDISVDGVTRALHRASDLAKSTSNYRIYNFQKHHRRSEKGLYKSPVQKTIDSLSLKEIIDVLKDSSEALKTHTSITNRKVEAMIVETQIISLDSNGQEIEQDFSIVNLSFMATASEDGEVQKRSINGGLALCYQIGGEVFSRHRFLSNCQLAGEQARELLLSPNCPEEKMTLLLAPDQMMLQIHESIGHPLEIDRILGDERNYAGWSFVKEKDFGELQYGSQLMNVTFDPTPFGELASYSYDDSGLKAEKVYLIQNGKLLRGLGSLESQSRSQLEGVANFRSASWNRPPIDRMANLNLEAGSSDLSNMISSIEKGIMMQSNRSWSIDDYRNKFQFGCEYGQLIKNGKIVSTVKNPNYRGVTVPFWRSLSAVSKNTETYGSPWCGKGEPSQVIRVGHSSPYCVFNNVEVFGG